jgi:hypothetical protein
VVDAFWRMALIIKCFDVSARSFQVNQPVQALMANAKLFIGESVAQEAQSMACWHQTIEIGRLLSDALTR